MTTNQIKWASTHDWYIDKSADNGAVLVKEVLVKDINDYKVDLKWFDNFEELRAWAGY